jgi:hypothetical protein
MVPVILSEMLKSCPVFPEKERTSLVNMLAVIALFEFESTKFRFCVCNPFLAMNLLSFATVHSPL